MSAYRFQIRQCRNPECGLRYPLPLGEDHPLTEPCLRCKQPTQLVLDKTLAPADTLSSGKPSITRNVHLEALLDNLRSAWNVGAIFRSADGLGVQRLHLCGISATPENKAVQKTSLGAEEVLPWTYAANSLEQASKLKAAGYRLIALEQDRRSVPLSPVLAADRSEPAVLIVGNEITGVDPQLLDLCSLVLHIPMQGTKRSLNVEAAFAIAAYQLLS
ncbi:MAG: RNA methyltransferase [Anaerolineales bacterium]|nr:RNA methyltransferase [Anaerolineales bacterium]